MPYNQERAAEKGINLVKLAWCKNFFQPLVYPLKSFIVPFASNFSIKPDELSLGPFNFLSFSLNSSSPHHPDKMSFGDLKSAAGLKKLNDHLGDKSYVEGWEMSNWIWQAAEMNFPIRRVLFQICPDLIWRQHIRQRRCQGPRLRQVPPPGPLVAPYPVFRGQGQETVPQGFRYENVTASISIKTKTGSLFVQFLRCFRRCCRRRWRRRCWSIRIRFWWRGRGCREGQVS